MITRTSWRGRLHVTDGKKQTVESHGQVTESHGQVTASRWPPGVPLGAGIGSRLDTCHGVEDGRPRKG